MSTCYRDATSLYRSAPSNLEQEPVIKETRPGVVGIFNNTEGRIVIQGIAIEGGSVVNNTSGGMVIQGLEINRLGSMANNASGRRRELGATITSCQATERLEKEPEVDLDEEIKDRQTEFCTLG